MHRDLTGLEMVIAMFSTKGPAFAYTVTVCEVLRQAWEEQVGQSTTAQAAATTAVADSPAPWVTNFVGDGDVDSYFGHFLM